MLNVFNEGTSERARRTSTEENSTLTWKTTERVEGTTNPATGGGGRSEILSCEKCVVTARSQHRR